MRILYLCDVDGGGPAEYALRQVKALESEGVEVTFLCRPSFDVQRVRASQIRALLPCVGTVTGAAPARLLQRIQDARAVARIATQEAEISQCDLLLIACYSEYFSPFWAPIYRRLARCGIPIGTIAHDPVRDYVLGPFWWHRWSVRQGYSFVRDVFVHDDTAVDFGGPQPAGIRLHRIPHGPFEMPPPKLGRVAMRERYGFGDGDRVFLSFGQIRNGKNLDRFLKAMTGLPPDVKLLVAGSSGGGSQRPPEEYRQMAQTLGLANRCAWDVRYIAEEEIGDLFAAADFALMTYSAKFRSASGVLNCAVSARKPVLASSGDGPLRSAVRDYRLGVFIPPDDDAAILDGARLLLATLPQPEWERYECENSWAENAKRVIAALG